MNKRTAALLLTLGFIQCTAGAAASTVNSRAGSFVGGQQGDISHFLGIPYATPPTGDLRWRAPRPLPASTDTFDGTQYGPACPQPQWSVNRDLPQSEDCLTLNIWAPDTNPDRPLPVMVWIHGGSFKVGSNRWWVAEGQRLAAKGVVVVSINYRLGLLGRFSHPALTAEQGEQTIANFGLADQVMALRWVRDNIGHFGGDQSNVTIFGYSAGAVSVNFLAALPSAKGLFHRVISQSSAVSIPRSRQMLSDLPGRPSLESEGTLIAEKLGLPPDAGSAELRALTVEQLLAYALPPGSMNPVVDGGVVTEDLSTSYRRGDLNMNSLIIGVDSWEASLARGMHAMPGPAFQSILTRGHGFTEEQVAETYGEDRDPYAVGDELFADGFHASSLWLAHQARDGGVDTYLYWFSYLPPAADPLTGVPHGGEVPYVFATLEHRERVGKPPVTNNDKAFSTLIQDYWTSFAAIGKPSAPGGKDWRALHDNDNWMVLGEAVGMKQDLLKERMALWMSHYEKQTVKPTEAY